MKIANSWYSRTAFSAAKIWTIISAARTKPIAPLGSFQAAAILAVAAVTCAAGRDWKLNADPLSSHTADVTGHENSFFRFPARNFLRFLISLFRVLIGWSGVVTSRRVESTQVAQPAQVWPVMTMNHSGRTATFQIEVLKQWTRLKKICETQYVTQNSCRLFVHFDRTGFLH